MKGPSGASSWPNALCWVSPALFHTLSQACWGPDLHFSSGKPWVAGCCDRRAPGSHSGEVSDLRRTHLAQDTSSGETYSSCLQAQKALARAVLGLDALSSSGWLCASEHSVEPQFPHLLSGGIPECKPVVITHIRYTAVVLHKCLLVPYEQVQYSSPSICLPLTGNIIHPSPTPSRAQCTPCLLGEPFCHLPGRLSKGRY